MTPNWDDKRWPVGVQYLQPADLLLGIAEVLPVLLADGIHLTRPRLMAAMRAIVQSSTR